MSVRSSRRRGWSHCSTLHHRRGSWRSAGLVLGSSWKDAASSSTFELALTLAYPVGDLVVVSAVLLAIMRTDRNRDAIPLLPIAASSCSAWPTASSCGPPSRGTEQAVSVADLGWTAGYLILLLAAAQYPLPVASGRASTT